VRVNGGKRVKFSRRNGMEMVEREKSLGSRNLATVLKNIKKGPDRGSEDNQGFQPPLRLDEMTKQFKGR